jgi:hypothetical protein
LPARNKISKDNAQPQGWAIREYYGKWILQQRPPFVRKSSERDQHFSRYILPRFGETSLAESALTTRALMDFQNYLLHDTPRIKKSAEPGLSVKTVRNIIVAAFAP